MPPAQKTEAEMDQIETLAERAARETTPPHPHYLKEAVKAIKRTERERKAAAKEAEKAAKRAERERKAAEKAADEAAKLAGRAAKAAEKEAEERRQKLHTASLAAAQHKLERRLLEVESAGDEYLEDPTASPDDINQCIEEENGKARETYCAELEAVGFDRPRAAWGAAKMLEARQAEKRTRNVQRALVNTAKRLTERREAYFLHLLTEWAHQQPLDSARGLRLPEANLRLEVWEDPPAPRIVDESAVCEAIIRELGEFGAIDQELVEVRYALNTTAVLQWVRESGLALEGMAFDHHPKKRIKIAPMGR